MGFTLKAAFLLLIILAYGLSTGFACSCVESGNIHERRDGSDLVFVGRLVEETVDSAKFLKRMKFATGKVLRRGVKRKAKWIWVETSLETAACGFEMSIGEKAMIFARTQGRSDLHETSLCSQNILSPERSEIDSLWMKRKSRAEGPLGKSKWHWNPKVDSAREKSYGPSEDAIFLECRHSPAKTIPRDGNA